MKVFAIAMNTYREAIRNKVLYSTFFFALLLIAVSAFFGAVSIGDQAKVIKSFGLFSLSFFGAISAILAGVSLLNRELKQKTVFNILSKPVERWKFVLGKLCGLWLTVSTLVTLMGFALVAFCYLFERRVDLLLFQGIFFVILEVGIVSALTIFFSSIVVTTTLTGLFTFGAYIAGRSIQYLDYFKQQAPDDSALATLISLFDRVLPDFNLFQIYDGLIYGIPLSAELALQASIYAFCYSLVLLLLSILIFQRREFL